MSDSVEYRTLSRCRDKLVTAFKLDSVTIADAFVSQSLISATIASEVNELATSEQKARRLVDCVFGQVLISDTQYDKFMSVFSQLDWLKDLVRILDSTHEELLQAHPPAVEDQPVFVTSGSIVKSDQVNSEVGMAVIHSNVERIEALFSALLLNVQAVFEATNVTVSRVRQFLVNFLKCEKCLPESICNFDAMFTTITMNGLWSYQHYSPLERLTDHFLPEEPQIRDFMRDYKSQLVGFFLTTKLVNYIEYKQLLANESDDDSDQQSTLKKYTAQHYRKIKIRLEMKRKLSEVSLGYVQKLWSSLAEEYELPSLTAIIDTIVDGSLEITWLLPPHIAEMIKPRAKFFRQFQVVQVFLDDNMIYDEKEMANYERRFLEMCKIGTAGINEFSHLLNLGVDPDIHDKDGFHPLWYASNHARADLLQLLIECRADVNLAMNDVHGKFGETALINSCCRGHSEIASVLIKNGADVNYMNKAGQSPLWLASYYGHSAIVLLLLQHHAQVDLPNNDERGETALFAASAHGHLETATLLLQYGAVVNYQDKTEKTPLYFASRGGHDELVDLLLVNGAEVDKGQQSPLYAASLRGRVEIVRRLIQRGADVNLPTDDEDFAASPLTVACENNHLEVVKILIDNGAMLNYQNKAGWTALLDATDEGHEEIVKCLLHSNTDTEIQNKEGRTALLVACWRGFLPIVVMLIKSGANTNAQDQDGLTGLMFATQKDQPAIVEVLLDAKADPNITDKTTGWTALFFASKVGNVKIVRLLIAKGAQVNLKDKNGLTAFGIAQLNGHHQVSEELKQHTTQETKTEITEEQKTQVKKSYQRLLRILDYLEETLLRGRKEKRLHQTVQKGVSSNIIEANQQLADNDNI